ncbi:MAG: multidrug efflux RND transporter permease subunit [Gammaproteobacteria bacterium]|jgi:HAE1 family hydrophobic/amphiphilic exporter-1|nr:multidrug efflux RND transporter permease subunit [Gammaproteobacteria bacterium]
MNFFINRPVFAAAIALMMILAGLVSMFVLPIAQYPPLVPSQIQVSTQYIGASSDVVANTVTTPLEEQLNGAEGMVYMSSNSTNNGNSLITMTFEVGYDQSIAQMEALTRSNQALSQLPPEVNQVGLTIEKHSSNIVLIVNLTSPNGTFDQAFLQNYADIHITDRLARIDGVASINNFGLRKYAMRIWLDPDRLANMGMTAMDVENAVEEQNNQVAAGKLGAPPAPDGQAFAFQLNALGRLESVQQFEEIVIRANPDGTVVRIKDVGRVELGAEDYSWSTSLNNKPTAAIAVYQLANANSIRIAKAVREVMTDLAVHFPDDLEWSVHYDTTRFIEESTREVIITLVEAILLVMLVVFVFLQNFRSTLIPTIAIPVSLIGTFVFMLAFDFSINTLSLLGLVVAVALVVDDAIVVVENVNRHLEAGATDMKKITEQAMSEVRGPVIATTIVLMAVFVPVAFIPGMTGQLYNQFALTIAIAVGLSGFNSLTLSPALAAVLLRPETGEKNRFFRAFNTAFDRLSNGYANAVKTLSGVWVPVGIVFAGLCVLALVLFLSTPSAFVPDEDQGYVMVLTKLPSGAGIQRTEQVVNRINQIAMSSPGVADVISVPGYNLIDAVQDMSAAFSFVVFKPYAERKSPETQLEGIIGHIQSRVAGIPEAVILVANAPPIPGLGSTGGFNFEIQDLNSLGVDALAKVLQNFLVEARKRPELAKVYSTFDPDVPQRYLEVDRVKAKTRGVSLDNIFNTLQINLGSLYVNQYNQYGRVYRVYLQAEKDARFQDDDITRLMVRNNEGKMIPLSAFVSIRPITGAYNIPHYNEYSSAQVNGGAAPGYSSGQANAAMEELADTVLPEGFGYEWTNLVYQQKEAGNLAPVVFAMSLIFVFLVLAAQYESWSMPVMILLAIPLGLLGAIGFLVLRNMDLDVYGQIGLVMLIGLVAKNSILIVQFAKDLHEQGAGIVDAAMEAARIRLRPILMTAFAFILGLMPLVLASGAGANARRSLGTAVVGGLTLATVLILFVPIFYVVIERMRERKTGRPANTSSAEPQDQQA